MRRPGQLIRLFYINFVMARHGIDRVVLSAPVFSSWRFLSCFNPWNWFAKKGTTRGERVRLILEDLGPLFVKFGQLLSTRQDLLPDDFIVELEKLQDSVPPFPGEQAKAIIENAYDCPIEEMFQHFDLTPLASASIAQVHAATLRDGKQIVVKVLRPNIGKTICRDLELMYSAAKLAKRFWPHSQRLRPVGVVAEFEHTINNELDLLREAANASQLRRNFIDSDMLYVPEIYWPYARQNVMIMERVDGVPIADIDTLRAKGVNLKFLAEESLEILFTQIFRDSFFHADMHPGNLFVNIKDPQRPTLIAVDFGIMGSLSSSDQRYIAENLLAVFQRDYRKIALLHLESAWLPANVRIDEFEFAMRSVCEPICEKPLKDISFGQLLIRLFRTATQFHVRLQPQLLLLQKTLISVEGLARLLDPELDLWKTTKPFLENWMRERYGLRALLTKIVEKAPLWAEKFTDMPDLLHASLQQTQQVPLPPPREEKTKQCHGFAIGFGLALFIAAGLNLWLVKNNTHLLIYSWLLTGIGAYSFLYGIMRLLGGRHP